jgi:hypothetical protein
MIQGNDDYGYKLSCDYCEEEEDEDFDEFTDAVAYKKENGYKSIKSKSGTWYEICPDCAEDPAIVQAIKEK